MPRPRFHLRIVLILIALVCIVLAPVAARMKHVRKQRLALTEIGRRFPGRIDMAVAAQAPNSWFWPREESVEGFCLGGSYEDPLDDEVVAQIGFFRDLRSLLFTGPTSLTDEGLAPIANLARLQRLSLAESGITDAGLAHLARLHELEYLGLGDTAITDAGLVHLEGLTKLQELDLYGTKVTAAGVKRLKAKLPQCAIDADVR